MMKMRIKIIASGIVLVLVLLASAAVGTASTLSNSGGGSWAYYKEITVNENSGKTLTDYQVLVELNSANFDFSKAKSDGSDIRFSLNGEELNYWIEEWNPYAKKAKIWVKVPHIPESGEVKIKMYYGNPSASAVSNGDKVFEFFDDFEEYSVGSHPIKWADADLGSGITEVTNVRSYHGTKCLLQNANGVGNGAKATKIADGGPWGNVAISSMYYDKGGLNAVIVGTYEPSNDPTSWGNEWLYLKHGSTHYVYREKSDGTDTGDIDTGIPRKVNQWVKFEFKYYNGKLKAYIDGQLAHITTKIDNIGRILLVDWWASTNDDYHDLVIVRKYTEPEPTLTLSAEYPVVRTALTLKKSVSPYSIKQGQKANVIITVENAGTTTLYDIEVVDAPPAEFEFVSGDTSARYTALKPGESRTFSYVIKSGSAGKFDLGKAKATYADEEGNYHTVESNAPMIEVLALLITPEIPREEKKISGFEIAFALAAIFTVARMRGRRRK